MSWRDIIKTTIQKEKEKKPEPNYSLGEIEYWRSRSATLSTLHQQLSHPSVNMVKKRLAICRIIDNSMNIKDFDDALKELNKLYSEAKDNVKFLNTLERQFKSIATENLNFIEVNIIRSFYSYIEIGNHSFINEWA